MMNFFRKILRDQRGFTLIELIIVVTILAVLAGVALLNSGGTEDEAKLAKAKTDVDTLATALKVYKIKEGKYPAALTDLTSDGTKGYKAMLDEIPNDPYGAADQDYAYTAAADGKTATVSTNDADTTKGIKATASKSLK